jgi:hypothetical protein
MEWPEAPLLNNLWTIFISNGLPKILIQKTYVENSSVIEVLSSLLLVLQISTTVTVVWELKP